MKNLILFITFSSLSLTGIALADGDIKQGKAASQTCAGCHGTDGNSANPLWPKLAGQGAKYLHKQLKDFKSGERKDPIMAGQASKLNSADMANLAAYYANQTMNAGGADKTKVALGKQIYHGGNKNAGVAACMSCHGPSGAGNPPAAFPRVGGQHAAYIVKAMKDFRSGKRTNDTNSMMRDIAHRMTDAEIEAVASYMQGLH